MSELPPLPDDLRALFEAESACYPEDPALQTRVLRGIEVSVAFAALAQASATGAAGATAAKGAAAAGAAAGGTSLATKTALLVGVVAFAAGVGVGEWHGRSSADAPALRVEAPTVPTAATTIAALSPDQARDAESVDFHSLPLAPSARGPASATAAAATSASAHAVGADGGDALAEEQALVDTARAALARGRAGDALRTADEHARRFPAGKLSEERENLAIQALAFLGRRDEATARAARFHKRYPGSLYGGTLDELLKAPGARDGGP
jgi:hypothetical protein